MAKKKKIASNQEFLKWLAGQDTTLSKNKLKKSFREQTGLSIGNQKANDLIGQALGKTKDTTKIHRKSKKPPKEAKTKRPKIPKYHEPTSFFPMPHKDMYLDKRYAWVIGYRYQAKDGSRPVDQYGFSDYVTIISDRQLSKRQIFYGWDDEDGLHHTGAAEYIDDGMSDNADNRYDDIRKWYPSSLTIVEKFYNPWKV